MERIQHIPKIEFSTGKNQYTYLLDSRVGFLSSRIAGKVDYLSRCGFIKDDSYFEQHEVTKEKASIIFTSKSHFTHRRAIISFMYGYCVSVKSHNVLHK